MTPLLSILIPSMHKRIVFLCQILRQLEDQIKGRFDKEVEILIDMDGGETPTGTKRNKLLEQAIGKYVVTIDDDDEISSNYIKEIIEALHTNPDVLGFKGWQTTQGKDRVDFKISKELPYTTALINGKPEYWRYNNHLSPVRREIAIQIKFPNIAFGEDYDYATRLKNSGLIKTEVFIDDFLYHYKFISIK